MRLALAPDVSFCLVMEHAVFMDVARNRYFALPAARLAEGDALEALIGRGLLSGRGPWHAGIEPAHASLATRVLEEGDGPSPARLAFACMRACAKAAFLLRFLPLARIVCRISERKRHLAPDAALDSRREARLVSAFRSLRPFAPPSRHGSRFESLALIEFLAGHGVAADWVFGVRTWPFSTFCWVQRGTAVLGGSLEQVRKFTPVRVV